MTVPGGAGPMDLAQQGSVVHGGGFGQCCNAENVTSEDKLIIATELTDDPTGMA